MQRLGSALSWFPLLLSLWSAWVWTFQTVQVGLSLRPLGPSTSSRHLAVIFQTDSRLVLSCPDWYKIAKST